MTPLPEEAETAEIFLSGGDRLPPDIHHTHEELIAAIGSECVQWSFLNVPTISSSFSTLRSILLSLYPSVFLQQKNCQIKGYLFHLIPIFWRSFPT
jgi:hypothetical protein